MAMIKSYGPFPVLLPERSDFRAVLVLSVLFGVLGADRFYQRKYVTGALKLLSAGGLGIWWLIDVVSILSGHATDKNGVRFRGHKRHYVIAWILTATLFAGLTGAVIHTAAPAVTAAAGKVDDAINPKPVPVPTWALLAELKGDPAPVLFTVTGDRLRFTYKFAAPAYAYLQEESDTSVPAQPLLLKDTAYEGGQEMALSPGKYRLIIRTTGTAWDVKIEDFAVRG